MSIRLVGGVSENRKQKFYKNLLNLNKIKQKAKTDLSFIKWNWIYKTPAFLLSQPNLFLEYSVYFSLFYGGSKCNLIFMQIIQSIG